MTTKITSMLLILIATLCVSKANAEDYYQHTGTFSGVIEVNKQTAIELLDFEANLEGGKMIVKVPDTAGEKSGTYQFTWKFLDNISQLVEGRKYRFTLSGNRIAGNAEKNTAIAYLKSSNGGSKIMTDAGYDTPGNTIQLQVPTSAVRAHPQDEGSNIEGVITVTVAETYSYFSIDFNFSSHPYTASSEKLVYSVIYAYESAIVKR